MLTARRLSIIIILLLAYISYRLLGANTSLATIGQIAFAALTQLAPAMIGALIWKSANRQGVFAGLTAGSIFMAIYIAWLPVIAISAGWSLEDFPGLNMANKSTVWLTHRPTYPRRNTVSERQLHTLCACLTFF